MSSVNPQSILLAQSTFDAAYRLLYSPSGASVVSSAYFKSIYQQIYGEELPQVSTFTNQDIWTKEIIAALSIAVISTLKTSEINNPLLAKGAELDNLVKTWVTRKIDVSSQCLFEIQTSNTAYPYLISAGATIKDADGNVLFETLEDFQVNGDRASFYFYAISPGEDYNGLSSLTGLVFSPRGGTTDENILTYQIYPSAGGITYQDDDDLRLDFYNSLSLTSAGSKDNYYYRIKSIFPEITDVYVQEPDIIAKGTVNIYITMIGGQVYDTNYLDVVKQTIFEKMPTTDSIVIRYATPVTVDLSTLTVYSTSVLSSEEMNAVVSAVNKFFSYNLIGKNVYKSQIIQIISNVNSKIKNVTILGIGDSVIIGETSFANPDFGSGITFSIV